jgi:hypothetical protein
LTGDALLSAALTRDRQPPEPPLVDLGGRSPEDFAATTTALGGLRWFVEETAKKVSPEAAVRGASDSERAMMRTLCEEALAWIADLYEAVDGDLIRRLIRKLPTDQLEEFKSWFREYTGAAVISESAAETIPTTRGRGGPKRSTIASGARRLSVDGPLTLKRVHIERV